jgi:hypothetical protein
MRFTNRRVFFSSSFRLDEMARVTEGGHSRIFASVLREASCVRGCRWLPPFHRQSLPQRPRYLGCENRIHLFRALDERQFTNRCFQRLLGCKAFTKHDSFDRAWEPTAHAEISEADGDRRHRLQHEREMFGDDVLGKPICRCERAENRDRKRRIQGGSADNEAKVE